MTGTHREYQETNEEICIRALYYLAKTKKQKYERIMDRTIATSTE